MRPRTRGYNDLRRTERPSEGSETPKVPEDTSETPKDVTEDSKASERAWFLEWVKINFFAGKEYHD
jgi:hypothetical protein